MSCLSHISSSRAKTLLFWVLKVFLIWTVIQSFFRFQIEFWEPKQSFYKDGFLFKLWKSPETTRPLRENSHIHLSAYVEHFNKHHINVSSAHGNNDWKKKYAGHITRSSLTSMRFKTPRWRRTHQDIWVFVETVFPDNLDTYILFIGILCCLKMLFLFRSIINS